MLRQNALQEDGKTSNLECERDDNDDDDDDDR